MVPSAEPTPKRRYLIRDLRTALERLNPDLPASAIEDAVREIDRL